MPKTIMITGPHAIGKTTTAESLAKLHPKLLFIPSFAGGIAKEMNYDLNKNPSIAETLAYQNRVLTAFEMSYDITLDENTIYDRSPLDFAAYTVLQLVRKANKEELIELHNYIERCITATMGFCDYLVIPEADLTVPYENKGNRPEFSEEQIEYRKKYSNLINMYANRVKDYPTIIRVPVGYQYEDRVKFIEDAIEEALV